MLRDRARSLPQLLRELATNTYQHECEQYRCRQNHILSSILTSNHHIGYRSQNRLGERQMQIKAFAWYFIVWFWCKAKQVMSLFLYVLDVTLLCKCSRSPFQSTFKWPCWKLSNLTFLLMTSWIAFVERLDLPIWPVSLQFSKIPSLFSVYSCGQRQCPPEL